MDQQQQRLIDMGRIQNRRIFTQHLKHTLRKPSRISVG